MADIKKGSDLITTMGATEKRLKKLERQLAVPRRGASSVITEETTFTNNYTPIEDQVTVVTTANCLVHIYFQLQAKVGSGDEVQVYLRNNTANTLSYYFSVVDNDFALYRSAPGTKYQATFPNTGAFTNDDLDDGARGGFLIFPINIARPTNFGFLFNIPSGDSITIKNRSLYVWVQPF